MGERFFLFFCICSLFLFCPAPAFSQNKPTWLVNLETVIQQKEKAWKVEDKLENYNSNSFDYNLTLKSGAVPLAIHITRLNNIQNPEETLAGQASVFSNRLGKNATRLKLKDFGEEGYIWKGSKGFFTKISFRKKDIFVDVFTSSEITAKRFAQYILGEIPKS